MSIEDIVGLFSGRMELVAAARSAETVEDSPTAAACPCWEIHIRLLGLMCNYLEAMASNLLAMASNLIAMCVEAKLLQ